MKQMIKNKKAIAVLLLVAMLFSIIPTAVFAEESTSPVDSIVVYVTIADGGIPVDGTNNTKMSRVPVYVSYDKNNDGYDIDDVLYAAHEQYYLNGADAGYSSYTSQYGLSLAILWGKGTENQAANAGYSINGTSAWSLSDRVIKGDHVIAYNYGEYDVYSFFDKLAINSSTGTSIELSLYSQTYDENWNASTSPIENAIILIDGEDTSFVTDERGCVDLLFAEENVYIISAKTTMSSLKISPICIASIDNTLETGRNDDFYNGDVYKLIDTIASSYIDNTSEWVIMDMAAYEDLNPETAYMTTDSAKQEYINNVIRNIAKEEPLGETDYAKAIIALASLGIDSTQLFLKNNNTQFNAVDELKVLEHSSSAWVAPHILAAYQQGNYDTEVQELALLDAVLANQAEDGSWSEWGDSIQTTSNMIAGLAFYYDEYADVKAAVDKAIEYLSSVQKHDGSYDAYDSGADANTAAMVVIALASVGINPDTDKRFIKNDVSALDNLLSFALADNTGFGYKDNNSLNEYSTEQGFRALIAASQVIKTGEAFNVYDFSGNTLVLGYEKEITSSGGSGSYVPKDDKITVKVSIKAIDGYWMQNKSVTLEEDATVSDALLKAIKGTGITQVGAEDGYIEYMEYNGMELGEYTNGDFSGWMYKVNGIAPNVGVTDYTLCDGDKILLYFTEDYREESMEEDEEKDEDKKEEDSKPTTAPVTEVLNDVDGHWAIDAIQFVYDRGLLTGISENEFAPDIAVSRAMMAAIMYGMAGTPENGLHYPFTDVLDTAWYAGSVAWAYENKLVYGVSDTSYAPETSITREQVAMMLMRYANFKGYDISQTVSLNHYKDAKNVSDYAESAMQWAVAIGMIGGRTADTLCAQDTATRAELSVMLRNFITLYETIDSYNSTTK